jgi:biotin carboxyl carrier protein
MNKEPEKLLLDDTLYETSFTKKFLDRKPYQKNDPGKITAFIPGIIRKVFVYEGKRSKKGESLLILEAMKMENNVKAPADVVIKKIHIKEGDIVVKNQLILEIELI